MTAITRGPCDEAVVRSAAEAPILDAATRRWVLAATILGSSMAFIDATVVNVALPVIQKMLGASVRGAQWVVEAYALGLSSLLLVGGALGDRMGRRRVFVVGVALFALASAACGLARVVYREDVGMNQPGGYLDFAVESGGEACLRRQLGAQHFDRDGPPVFEVVGMIHHRHAASPELARDLVAIGERRA